MVLGATTVLQHIRRGARGPKWILDLLARRPLKVAAVALANKMACIVYALLTKDEDYRVASEGPPVGSVWQRPDIT